VQLPLVPEPILSTFHAVADVSVLSSAKRGNCKTVKQQSVTHNIEATLGQEPQWGREAKKG
jgi:hypothetical protein